MICFLQANSNSNKYFDIEDICNHPRLRQEHVLMSSASILQVEMNVFEADFIATVVAASERDQQWTTRKGELEKKRKRSNGAPKKLDEQTGTALL